MSEFVIRDVFRDESLVLRKPIDVPTIVPRDHAARPKHVSLVAIYDSQFLSPDAIRTPSAPEIDSAVPVTRGGRLAWQRLRLPYGRGQRQCRGLPRRPAPRCPDAPLHRWRPEATRGRKSPPPSRDQDVSIAAPSGTVLRPALRG